MRNLSCLWHIRRGKLLAICVPILFFLLSLTPPAEGQEVKTIGVKGFNDLLAANKGKVVVLDFWATF